MTHAASDEQLMRAWKQGDFQAFRAIYDSLRGPLYRFIHRQTTQQQLADDIYQETWATFVRQKDKWQPKASLKTFLFRIAHSRLVDHFRVSGRQVGFDDASPNGEGDDAWACPMPDPEASAVKKRDAQALLHCLNALPPEQREAFLLSEEDGLRRQDIARVTGVKDETVKSRIRYALSRLRQCLSGFQEAL